MVVKLSSFLSTSLADGLDSALVTGIIANTDVALDSGTTGNYIATITGGDGITVVDGAAHEAAAIVRVDSATVATADNTLTVTNKTFNLTNNTLTGTLGQFNAALNGSTFASLDGGETLTNKTLTSPTINTPQIVGPGSFSKVTTLGLRDQTTNAFDLRVFSNSSTALTDNRTLTVDVENVNRSVKLGGDLIIDKELRTAGDFNLLMNLTDSTNITLPTSGTVMQFDSNGASTITGAFTAGTLSGHYLGADSDVTELVTKSFVDNLGVDASTLGGRDSDYFLNYNNFTNTPAGSVALASLGVNAPSNPSNGQLWWDDSAGNLYVYYVDSDGDTQWVEAVPQLAAEDFVSNANITNSSTGTTFTSNSYNIITIETDKNDDEANTDGIIKITNGSSGAVKGEIRWDESTNTFELSHGDNQNHLCITSEGHVGIGTNAPADANWNSSTYGNTEFAIDGGGGYSVLHMRGDGAGSSNTRFSMGVGDDKFFMAYDDVNNTHRLCVQDDVFMVNQTTATALMGVCVRGGLRVAQIASDTNNISGTDAIFHLTKQDNKDWGMISTNNAGSGTDYGIKVEVASNASYAYAVNDGTAIRFQVNGNGNVQNQNNSYGSISDQRLKENIADANSQWDDIKNLRIRKYSMIEDSSSVANQIGVIAQELESDGMSGLVLETPDLIESTTDQAGTSTKTVKYSVLYMKAVKALQEAMIKIEDLEARVATLEG